MNKWLLVDDYNIPTVSKVPLPLKSLKGSYPNMLIWAVSLPHENPYSTGSYIPLMP